MFDIRELCKEVGNCFGEYFEEDNQLCIDNGVKIFRYNTEKELLGDWVETLISQHLSCNGQSGGNWEKEIAFIYESVLGKYPKGVRPCHGKKKTKYKAEAYVNDGTPHGAMRYLGVYDSIVDAVGAMWEHKGTTVESKQKGKKTMQKKNYEQWKQDFVQRLEEHIRNDPKLGTRGPLETYVSQGINGLKRECMTMPKLNTTGLSPAVYLDAFYMRYQLDEPEEEMIDEITSIFSDHTDVQVDTKALLDYERMKEHLRIRVNGAEKNSDWLTEMVSQRKGDFVYSAYLFFHENERQTTINVKKLYAKEWGVSEEAIMAEARKNEMTEPVELASMYGVIDDFLNLGEKINLFEHPDEMPEDCILFVLRETDSPYGAAVLARDEVLKAAGELLQDDYYIMPSSIREVLLVPSRFGNEMTSMNELIREINLTEVEPEEILSDHAQYYDRKLQMFMNAEEYRRMKRFLGEDMDKDPGHKAVSPEQSM